MKCSNCGTESGGNFCSSCGAPLKAGDCTECGAKLPAGARFCTRCGAAAGTTTAPRGSARGQAAGGNPNLPWYLAGGVLLLLIIILVVPLVTGTGARPSDQLLGPAVPLAPGTPPPLTGSPRDQADRLFDRIMTAAERGDTAEALRFTPMAIDAYGMAAPLDDDGRYHLAVVHLVAGNTDAAISTAEQILADNENHLLGLAVAGEASERAGNLAAARTYYGRLLAAYDAEVARSLPEYQAHMRSLPEFRANAQRITDG
ncbi:MAG: zinc-ribbon domain-containing protein [Gemmatimonadetes bacterium]|nr:zinc-ribbon domain-containing protein [Gemmatimonadota bacterium]